MTTNPHHAAHARATRAGGRDAPAAPRQTDPAQQTATGLTVPADARPSDAGQVTAVHQAGSITGIFSLDGSTTGVHPSVSDASDSGSMPRLGTGAYGRQTFAADELAIVLSHYDLGSLEAVQEFPRGSRKAPKLLVRAQSGLYLLKRRARGKDDPFKVAFCHSMQMHLADQGFPLPHLIGTRHDNNSMLQWKGQVYELFEYIKGSSYDSSLEATTEAGAALANFHSLLKDFRSDYEAPLGSYHASRSVSASFRQLPKTLQQTAPAALRSEGPRLARVLEFLQQAYQQAADEVERAGFRSWPEQIVHCDWHPGNLLYRGSRVIAVIDYDAARIQQRVVDIANGALQFSILGGGDDPSQWPEYLDESRFRRFLYGHRQALPTSEALRQEEVAVLPWLMVEALIAEAVIPIATSGYFGRIAGVPFLKMVVRKVQWLHAHRPRLLELAQA